MDFIELSQKRESCRDFSGEPVPREALEKILEAGRLAPSACNSQPWHFYVVSGANLDQMREGVQFMGGNKFTDKATAFIAITGEKENYPERVGQRIFGRDFSNMDIGICVENMSLCARSLGYGSCILGSFLEKDVKCAIGLEKKNKSVVKLVLALGVPSSDVVREKKRKSFEEVATFVD